MTEISLPLDAISNRTQHINEDRNGDESWRDFTAFLCLAGGISFGVIGLFLTGIGHFSGAGAVEFKVGMTLFFSCLPLMMLGAYTLRKVLEETKKI